MAEPNFAAALRATDLAAARLIQGAGEASRSHHRFCAEIAVEATRALLSFEEILNWANDARAELGKSGIRVNGDVATARFRIVTRLVFRDITKVDQGDGDLAHGTIGASQLTRYAQVVEWTYEKIKAGQSIDVMAAKILSAGGIRKVAELQADGDKHRRTIAEIDVVGGPDEGAEPTNPGVTPSDEHLRVLGRLKLDRAFRDPKVSLTYPDGTVVEAPISADQNSSLVAAWTGITG